MKKQNNQIELRMTGFAGVLHTWSAEEVAQIKKDNKWKLLFARLQRVTESFSPREFFLALIASLSVASFFAITILLSIQIDQEQISSLEKFLDKTVDVEEVMQSILAFMGMFFLFMFITTVGFTYLFNFARGENTTYRKTFFALLYDSLDDDFYINNLREIKKYLLKPDTHPFIEITAFFNGESIPFEILNNEVMVMRVEREFKKL